MEQIHLILRLRSPLPSAILLAVLVRGGVFFYACLFLIFNEDGYRVSPLVLQVGSDLNFYMQEVAFLQTGYFRSLNQTNIIDHFTSMLDLPFEEWSNFFVAGPGLPLLLIVFDYKIGNTLPLSFGYLLLGSALTITWLIWLHHRGLSRLWLLVFAVVPNPMWFMLNISSDLLFAAFVAAFIYFYFSERRDTVKLLGCISIAILALLIRPNGLALFVFLMIDIVLVYWVRLSSNQRVVLGGVVAITTGVAGFYYTPYFLTFVAQSNTIEFFGLPQKAYFDGIVSWLPTVLDVPLGIFTLAVSKVLYFTGLRPSYAGIPDILVLLRAAIGLVLLPGLIWAFMRAPRSMRLFLAIYCLPIFLGASQERYNLAIQPILFYYGVFALRQVLGFPARLIGRTAEKAPQDD